MIPPKHLPPAEAAAYARVSEATLRRWVRENKLTRHRIDGTRSVRYAVAELDALVVAEVKG